jgi:hypothetical protein
MKLNRRDVFRPSAVAFGARLTARPGITVRESDTAETRPESRGDQRLSLDQLRAWEALGFGMFIHFGMSTFDGNELSRGDRPSSHYGTFLVSRSRHTNLLLDVPPDRHGLIPAKYVESLSQLEKNITKLGMRI